MPVTRRHVLGLAAGSLLAAAGGGLIAAERKIAIANGKVAKDDRTVRLAQGDHVALGFTTDKPLELHFHGYDIKLRVEPGATGWLRFEAKATGRFPVTVHGGHGDAKSHGRKSHERALLYVEVHPR